VFHIKHPYHIVAAAIIGLDLNVRVVRSDLLQEQLVCQKWSAAISLDQKTVRAASESEKNEGVALLASADAGAPLVEIPTSLPNGCATGANFSEF